VSRGLNNKVLKDHVVVIARLQGSRILTIFFPATTGGKGTPINVAAGNKTALKRFAMFMR